MKFSVESLRKEHKGYLYSNVTSLFFFTKGKRKNEASLDKFKLTAKTIEL